MRLASAVFNYRDHTGRSWGIACFRWELACPCDSLSHVVTDERTLPLPAVQRRQRPWFKPVSVFHCRQRRLVDDGAGRSTPLAQIAAHSAMDKAAFRPGWSALGVGPAKDGHAEQIDLRDRQCCLQCDSALLRVEDAIGGDQQRRQLISAVWSAELARPRGRCEICRDREARKRCRGCHRLACISWGCFSIALGLCRPCEAAADAMATEQEAG